MCCLYYQKERAFISVQYWTYLLSLAGNWHKWGESDVKLHIALISCSPQSFIYAPVHGYHDRACLLCETKDGSQKVKFSKILSS